jgi:hypothetical protein
LLVIVVCFALLSVWGAYRLQQGRNVLLGGTYLRDLPAAQIKEGTELLRRLKRLSTAEQVPKPLIDQIISRVGRAIRDIHDVAPELGNELNAVHGAGPDSRDLEHQIHYVGRVLEGLRRLALELEGPD